MLLRRKYLDRIRSYYDSDLIKVLTGIRRAGKSTILRQIVDELSKSIEPDRIFFFDFESFDAEKYYENPHAFYDMVKSFVQDKKQCYIFLDEIQHMQKFELVIASMRSALNCSVFVTGSNSTLLSGELSTRLTGRVIEFLIMPFSYSEMAEYIKEDTDETFSDYLLNGGIPVRFNQKIDFSVYARLLYEGILNKDIFSVNDIENRNQFLNFSSYILASSGNTISTESIAGYLKSIKDPVAISTAYRYLDYLENAFLVNKCKRFDIKGKQMLSTRMKYYAIDPCFIYMQNGNKGINQAFVLETIIFNELLSRGYEVSIGKTYKGEIDFVVSKNNERCYIQVCYLLANDETINREFSAFSSIKDNYPKYVLSLDKLNFSREGIKHINIRDFLMKRRDISF